MKQTMGAVISERRKARNMTQAELAARMGVTDKAVSKWERDRSCPDVQSLSRLAAVLGISVEALLAGVTDAPHKQTSAWRQTTVQVLRALALAMGVAAVVLTRLGGTETGELCALLGIGLTASALASICK